MMAIEDVVLRNLNILRFMIYVYAYVSGSQCPWPNAAGLRRNGVVLIIAENLHVNRHLSAL